MVLINDIVDEINENKNTSHKIGTTSYNRKVKINIADIYWSHDHISHHFVIT